jgi:hypothetical protein
MSASKVILEQSSPNGNLSAVVESDGRVVYLYLFCSEPLEGQPKVKTCWVRNLKAAPKNEQVRVMKTGNPPMLPVAFCKHPDGAAEPIADDLEIVWFEEGDAAAVLEKGDILAIIPAWSGINGFAGYARDCAAEHHLCWPLPPTDVLPERIRRAKEFWSLWDDRDFWTKYRDGLMEPIEATLGRRETKYYAIDGGNWPPKALLLFDLPDCWLLITVGVSLRPQPNVEMHMKDPSPARRIELAVALERSCPSDELMRMANYISGQSSYPWSRNTWLGEGHTFPCDSTPAALGGEEFPAVLLTGKLDGTPQFKLPEFRGDPINVLWMLPITAAERALAMQENSTALLKKLKRAGVCYVARKRKSVV